MRMRCFRIVPWTTALVGPENEQKISKHLPPIRSCLRPELSVPFRDRGKLFLPRVTHCPLQSYHSLLYSNNNSNSNTVNRGETLVDRETDTRDSGEAVAQRINGLDTTERSTMASEQCLVAPEQRAAGEVKGVT